MQNRAGIDTVTSSPDLDELPSAIARPHLDSAGSTINDVDGDVDMGVWPQDSSPGGAGGDKKKGSQKQRRDTYKKKQQEEKERKE